MASTYLMWIGSEHYESFAVYADEVRELGVSKRLPSVGAARHLLKPGTIVFVAHDDGKKTECLTCRRKIRCPECRPRKREIGKLKKEIEHFRRGFPDLADFRANASGFALRSVRVRVKKAKQAQRQICKCKSCEGAGAAVLGSGGVVTLDDGKRWDYRTYTYWLHQPAKFDASRAVGLDMCKACGGKGTMPQGRIHGLFMPEKVEHIASGKEGPAELRSLRGFASVSRKMLRKEPWRKCGRRKKGGLYVVTTLERSSAAIRAAKKLIGADAVKRSEVRVKGGFVEFLKPVDIGGVKRFRGLKRFDSKTPDLAEEVSMILDAL